MKKLLCAALNIFMASILSACGGGAPSGSGETPEEEFKPSLDVNTKCTIKIVGDYDNFEALEAEFDKFNEYYKDVTLTYTKISSSKEYDNTLATVLAGNEKPNIFFTHPKMIDSEDYKAISSNMEVLSDSSLKININCIRSGLISHDKDKNVLMVPVFSRTYGMLVNNDLFKKEDIAIPNSWEELLTTCEAFESKEYKSPMMGYSKSNDWASFMNTVAYPLFVAELAKTPGAIDLANNLDPSAGEYMRGALNAVKKLVDDGCVDVDECNLIEDNYKKLLLRFFEGDVPMMICNGDAVSGTRKREKESEAYQKSPFEYSYLPIPTTDQGGYFIDSPSKQFAVNKNCENLDMTNEFMRFIISSKELNTMADVKLLLSPAKDNSFDSIYAPFGKIPAERTLNPEGLGVKETLSTQIRIASYKVGKGELSVDDAVSQYGTFK